MRRSGGVFVFLLAVAGPLLAQEPVPTPAQATETPGPAPASDGGPTVSAPPAVAAPAAGSVRLKLRRRPGQARLAHAGGRLDGDGL